MANTINIFLYSYKNKNLLDRVKDIYFKSSKKNIINIFVYDQNNLDRKKIFNELHYVKYNHISWDSCIFFSNYINDVINKNFDYYLEIGDNVVMSNNWDAFLINFLKNKKNIVISGNHKIKLINKNNILKKINLQNNKLNKTNFIDLNFIFMKKENTVLLKNNNLRFYNKDLFLSLLYTNNNIEIYSLPSDFYIDNQQSFLINSYTPYSLYENYDLVVEYIKNNDCTNFNSFHNIDLKKIKKINNYLISPKYQYQNYIMDNNKTRFIKNTKTIFTKTFYDKK